MGIFVRARSVNLNRRNGPRMRRQLESHSEVLAEVRKFLRNGESGAALETREQALKKAPDDAEIHDLMAGVYYLPGNHGVALPHAQKATMLAPDVAA